VNWVICVGGDSEGFGYPEGFTVVSGVSEVQAAFGARLKMPLRGRSHSGNAVKIVEIRKITSNPAMLGQAFRLSLPRFAPPR
jgi:hypothetical protein